MTEAQGPEPLLVFPDPPPPLLAQTLDLAGYSWKAVENPAVAVQAEPRDGWAGAVVIADEDPEGAFGICRALRKRDARAPFRVRFRVGVGRVGRRVRAEAVLRDGRRVRLARAVRPCTRANAVPRFTG